MANNYAILLGAFSLSATALLFSNWIWLAAIPGALAVAAGVAFLQVLIKINRADRMP